MSTVLPLIVSRTIVPPLESVVAGGGAPPGAAPRCDQPGVLDVGQQGREVGQRELALTAGAGRRFLLCAGRKVYLDHAARPGASPTERKSSGAPSSTATASNTASRTLSRC